MSENRKMSDEITTNFQRATSFDDWIWVKDKAFSIQENTENCTFYVEWNALDNVFAVTSRTGSRGSQDVVDRSVTGAFSLSALHSIQATLQGINPEIQKLPSSLPKQPKGLTALFVGLKIPKNMSKVCKDLESHFTKVSTLVGNQVMNEVMFEAAAHTLDVYYEKMSDVYKNDLEQRIKFSEEVLKNIAFERDNCTVMKDLEDVYEREDETIIKLRTTLAEFYNYELQPYLDSRCLATKKIQYYSEQIKSADVGERVQKENEEQHLYWACLLIQADEVACGLYVEHQSYIVSMFENIIDQLNIDRNRYGPAAFDLIAGERELRLHQELHAAKVDLLQSKRKQLKQKKDKLVMQIPEEESGRAQSQETKKLIHSKHKLQEKIFGLELDILTEKKWLLHTQIAIRKRELSEASDEQIVFHDAVEDVAELSDEEEEETLDIMRNDEELVKLKLERVKLTQHQSKIRNKQKELAKGLKVRQRQEEEEELRIQRHHQVQMKRDKQKEEENEKSSFIFEERKKTIERLKEYKVKYTAPKTIKPPRYQRPSDTKNRSSKPASTNSKSKVSSRQSTKPAIQTPKTASPQAKKSKFLPKQKTGVDDTKKLQDIPVTIFACEKDLQSKTDLSVPPASPPPPPLPPPPPPPPPPPLLPSSPPVSASGPPKPTNLMEELSQGQNLLKKVDMSTSSKEASGTPGPIDLGSILASRSKLKPASARQERPPLLDRTDPLEDIFSMIRSGVTLRKVSSDPPPGESGQGDPMISSISSSIYSTDARSQLHNTLLNKICRGVRGTTPESDDEFGSENDEFDDD